MLLRHTVAACASQSCHIVLCHAVSTGLSYYWMLLLCSHLALQRVRYCDILLDALLLSNCAARWRPRPVSPGTTNVQTPSPAVPPTTHRRCSGHLAIAELISCAVSRAAPGVSVSRAHAHECSRAGRRSPNTPATQRQRRRASHSCHPAVTLASKRRSAKPSTRGRLLWAGQTAA